MDTYVSNLRLGYSNDISPLATTMFGICNSGASTAVKIVQMSNFDSIEPGVVIWVKFTNGSNTMTNAKLQVGNSNAIDIIGDFTCSQDEVVAFILEKTNDNVSPCWHPQTAGISAALRNYIINLIDTTVSTPDVLIFKGTIGNGGNPGSLPVNGYQKGWFYYILTDGTYLNTKCETGDMIIAIQDASPSQYTANVAHWAFIQHKKDKIVTGPNTSTANHVVVFDDNTGTVLADSGFTLEKSVPSDAVFTDTTYSNGVGLNLNNANEFSIIFGNTAGSVTEGNDPRLSDAREPTAHAHGNITNDGTLGSNTALVQTLDGDIVEGPRLGNDTTLFLNNTGNWAELPVTSVNGKTGGAISIELSDFGIDIFRFMGITNLAIVPNSNMNPNIGSYDFINARANGDVILSSENNREYVWIEGNGWTLLGQEFSEILDTDDLTINQNRTSNVWVSRIIQDVDRTITTEMGALDTSGTWTGNANTATQFAEPQTVYVDLETNSVQTTIQGGSSTAEIVGVTGILPISNGGTNASSFAKNQVIISNNPLTGNSATELISRPYTDNLSAIALNSSSTNFLTERTVYFGLPFINNVHNYTSNTTIFAPETAGEQYSILVSGRYNLNNVAYYEPQWAPAAFVNSEISTGNGTAYSTLILGNNTSNNSAGNSTGRIQLYSNGTGSHTIIGSTTNNTFTHSLPNANGILVQIPNQTQVGSNTEPVYIAADGTVVALTYVPNRLYYSDAAALAGETTSNNFLPSNHYANENKIGINIATAPTDNFYVNGTSAFEDVVKVMSAADITGGSTLSGALQVSGGADVNRQLRVGTHLTVLGNSTLTENVGIGVAPETGNNAHLLVVNGTASFLDNIDITGIVNINNTTVANSTTGALIVAGGIRTAKNIYVDETSTLLGNVSIGDEVNTSSTYQLTIHGDTEIIGEASLVTLVSITSTINSVNIEELAFRPTTTNRGLIGDETYAWREGHFSHLLKLTYNTASIVLSTYNSTNASAEGIIHITADTPTLSLSSSASNSQTWNLTNDSSSTFTLSNNAASPMSLKGKTNGFEIVNRLYINEVIPNNPETFYVNGTTELHGNTGINTSHDANYSLSVEGSIQALSGGTPYVYLNLVSGSTPTVQFYPLIGKAGLLGLSDNRWHTAYLSNLLEVGVYNENNNSFIGTTIEGAGTITINNNNSSILLDTTPPASGSGEKSELKLQSDTAYIQLLSTNSTADNSEIDIVGNSATLIFDTLAGGGSDWSIINNGGIFTITNESIVSSNIQLTGNNYGFQLSSCLYINDNIPTTNNAYSFYVTGDSCSNGNLVPTISTNNVPDKTLGSTTKHWAALYVGEEDTYGDPYLPIYWLNGVPTYTNGFLQKKSFVFSTGDTSVTLEDAAYNQLYGIETFVIQIVVTSGEQYLNGKINWTTQQKENSTTLGQVILTTTAVTGIVSGYILTARGKDLDPSST